MATTNDKYRAVDERIAEHDERALGHFEQIEAALDASNLSYGQATQVLSLIYVYGQHRVDAAGLRLLKELDENGSLK